MSKSVRLAAKEAMQRHGYDPIDVLVQMATAEDAPKDLKLDVGKTLLPYMYPKLSSVAIEAEVGTNENANMANELLMKMLSDPGLADSAQKLSLAAAEVALRSDGTPRHDKDIPGMPGMVQ